MEHPTVAHIEPSSAPRRPLGVGLLTIFAALGGGIIPIVVLVAIGATGFELSPLSTLFTVVLALSIIIAAIGTWRGSNKARRALLILVTIHYAVIAINNATLLFDGSGGGESRLIGRIVRGLLYPAIYIWYFQRPETMRFYLPESQAGVQEVLDG